MKKILFLLLFAPVALASGKDSLIVHLPRLPFPETLWEDDDCDACGCSASGGSMGFASMLNSHFIGLRYLNQRYKTTDGLYSNSPWYTENFNTIQVWGRIPITKKLQLSALAPYHFHSRETGTGKQSISGIGDVTLLGLYSIWQTHKDSAIVTHNFQLGGGIKIPVGSFDEANNGSVNPSYQLGTGSWDFHFTTEYVLQKKQFGINTMLNYVWKTENEKQYRFGNQFNYATTFFYLKNGPQLSWAPQLGIAGEVYESNYQLGQKVRNTAGNIVLGKLGVEVGKKNLSAGFSFMLPLSQRLNSGNVEAQYRWSINLNYSL